MSELRTDEEQVEMLKKWWEENGKSLLLSIIVVAGGWVGWNFYQDQQQATGEAASALYSQLTEKAAEMRQQPDGAAATEAVALAEQLKSEFAGSTYADFASLFLARFAATAGDADSAMAELRSLTESADAPVKYLAKVRLANLLVDQDKSDEALALVATVDDEAYKSQYLEARGDALFRQGKSGEARAAYLEALEAARELGHDTQLLQRKADFLVASEAN